MSRPGSASALDEYAASTARESAGGVLAAGARREMNCAWTTVRGSPSTVTEKSDASRSGIGLPSRPRTLASTSRSSTPLRKMGGCWAGSTTLKAATTAIRAAASRVRRRAAVESPPGMVAMLQGWPKGVSGYGAGGNPERSTHSPSRMTRSMSSVLPMSASGSAFSTIRSATLPASRVP